MNRMYYRDFLYLFIRNCIVSKYFLFDFNDKIYGDVFATANKINVYVYKVRNQLNMGKSANLKNFVALYIGR